MRQRHWESDVGWVSDAPPQTCRTCGAEIPKRAGKGGPLRYCAAHAPANRTAAASWYERHRDERREYVRQHASSKPLVERVCPDCGVTFRTWSGAVRCLLCRSKAKRAAAWQAKFAATVPIICPECRGVCPPYAGRLRARTYCSERCRNRANDRRRVPRHRTANVAP